MRKKQKIFKNFFLVINKTKIQQRNLAFYNEKKAMDTLCKGFEALKNSTLENLYVEKRAETKSELARVLFLK